MEALTVLDTAGDPLRLEVTVGRNDVAVLTGTIGDESLDFTLKPDKALEIADWLTGYAAECIPGDDHVPVAGLLLDALERVERKRYSGGRAFRRLANIVRLAAINLDMKAPEPEPEPEPEPIRPALDDSHAPVVTHYPRIVLVYPGPHPTEELQRKVLNADIAIQLGSDGDAYFVKHRWGAIDSKIQVVGKPDHYSIQSAVKEALDGLCSALVSRMKEA